MGHRSFFESNAPASYELMGEDAVFTPLTGDPVACHVFLDFQEEAGPEGMESKVSRRVPTIDALLSEIGRAPVAGETFTIDGVVYKVSSPVAGDGISVVVEAEAV